MLKNRALVCPVVLALSDGNCVVLASSISGLGDLVSLCTLIEVESFEQSGVRVS